MSIHPTASLFSYRGAKPFFFSVHPAGQKSLRRSLPSYGLMRCKTASRHAGWGRWRVRKQGPRIGVLGLILALAVIPVSSSTACPLNGGGTTTVPPDINGCDINGNNNTLNVQAAGTVGFRPGLNTVDVQTGVNNQINNQGLITARNDDTTVQVQAGTSLNIVNAAGARIRQTGNLAEALLARGTTSIDNSGSVGSLSVNAAADGVEFSPAPADNATFVLINRAGATTRSLGGSGVNMRDGTITNDGNIYGGVSGIEVTGTRTSTITNNAAGRITIIGNAGPAIQGGNGVERVVNAGLINGSVLLGDGADEYVHIADTAQAIPGGESIDGGAGVDALTLTSNADNGPLDIDQFVNFESLTKDGNGRLSVSGGPFVGTKTVAAGTLAGTAATLAGDIVNNAQLEFAQGADGTYADSISGSGTVLKTGNGVLSLTGTNSYTGGTTVQAGILSGNSDGLQGNITNNTEVRFDQAADGTYAGVMSGPGALVKNGGSVLALSGANSYTGGTTVNAGTLSGDTTSLQGNIVNNAALRFDQNVGGAFGDVISGTGSLEKAGGGTLTLSGTNVFSGPTTVSGGVLSVIGSMTSAITALNGTSVQGTGSVGGIALSAGSRLAPGTGNDARTLTVNGDYVQQPGSSLDIEIAADGSSDRVAVTGAATVNGGTLTPLRLSPEDDFDASTIYTILTATGGVSGDFDTVNAGDFAFLTPTFKVAPNAITLAFQQSSSFESVAETENQRTVGAAFDRTAASATGDYETIVDELVTLSANEARDAYDSLSGDSHATWTTIGMYEHDLFLRSVQNTGLSAEVGASPLASLASLNAANALYTGAAVGGGAAGDDGRARGYRTWGTGYVVTGDLDGDGNAEGTNYTIGGFGGGADTTIGDYGRLGLAIGATTASGSFDSDRSDSESVTWNGALYGQWAKERLRLDGILGIGYRDNTVDRNVVVGNIARNSDVTYHSTLWSASAMARYLIPAKVVNIEPLVGIRYFKSDATNFTESGAGSVNLRGSVEDFTSLRSALGATFSRELAGKRGPIVLEARLAWEHEFKDRSARLDARFAGASGSNFEARGVEVDRDSALVGLGMRAEVDRNATLMASYAGRFNADVQAHQFSAAVRWEW